MKKFMQADKMHHFMHELSENKPFHNHNTKLDMEIYPGRSGHDIEQDI